MENNNSNEIRVSEAEELKKYSDDPRVWSRIAKMYECYREEEERKALHKQSLKEDLKFSLDFDEKLSAKMEKAVKEYWRRYEFAFPNMPDVCRTYYNRNGIFDPAYYHNGMRNYLHEWTCPEKVKNAFQNKSNLESNFTDARFPFTLAKKIESKYYGPTGAAITYDDVKKLCMEQLNNGTELVIKCLASKEILFVSDLTDEELENRLGRISGNYLIQSAIKQHDTLGLFNNTSVNTLRLTTLILDDSPAVLAGLLRVGQLGSRVDSFYQGGYIIGVSDTGSVYSWALTSANQKIDVMPSGLDLKEHIRLPFYNEAVEMVKAAHMDIADIRLVSWDICFDDAGPMIMGCNFNGDLRLHQAVTGPIFGAYSSRVYDELFLRRFYKNRADLSYDFKEYASFVIITAYAGDEEDVVIPAKINGKPVRRIEKKAFCQNKNLRSVVLPDTLRWIDREVFRGCRKLETVSGGENLKKIGKLAFKDCVSLTAFDILPDTEILTDSFEGCRKYMT